MKAFVPIPRPVILVFVHYYLPGYKSGGPIRTIANMVDALGDELDFRIVTSDRDATDTMPFLDLPVDGVWAKVGKAHVLYLAPERKGLRHIAKILRETPHDTLYLNSFFEPNFTQKPLLARLFGLAPKARCVIAPRGEFSQGALGIRSRKKKIFLLAARITGLYRGLIWQASSQHERVDIRRTLGSSLARHIEVAIDMPDTTPRQPAPFVPRAPGEPLRICFLSRISPMKNLDFALEVLRGVRNPVQFDIYGPVGDENYWSRCQALIARLPASVRATYKGSVRHADVSSTLARYDLFLLPTRGENYGHVILESLCAGTPVLIADTTPWLNLRQAGVGWDFPLEKMELFTDTIDYIGGLAIDDILSLRKQAYAFAEARKNDVNLLDANKKLFCAIA